MLFYVWMRAHTQLNLCSASMKHVCIVSLWFLHRVLIFASLNIWFGYLHFCHRKSGCFCVCVCISSRQCDIISMQRKICSLFEKQIHLKIITIIPLHWNAMNFTSKPDRLNKTRQRIRYLRFHNYLCNAQVIVCPISMTQFWFVRYFWYCTNTIPFTTTSNNDNGKNIYI